MFIFNQGDIQNFNIACNTIKDVSKMSYKIFGFIKQYNIKGLEIEQTL